MREIIFQSRNGPIRMREERPGRLYRERNAGGVLWGHDDPVLIVQPSQEKALLWSRGASVWSGMYGTYHVPGDLRLWQPSMDRTGNQIGEDGGRLSRGRVLGQKKIIEAFFDVKIDWGTFHIFKTLLLGN